LNADEPLGLRARVPSRRRYLSFRDATRLTRDAIYTAFAQRSDDGLIVTGSPEATIHRALIITLARYQLPAIYFANYFVADSA
jgi:hypothetical protein